MREGRLSCRRRLRFLSSLGTAAAALGALVSGCGSGQAVSDSAQQVFFQVPSGWKVYNQVQMGNNIPGLSQSQLYFFRAASGNPRPKPSDIFTPSPYPWLLVEVRSLSPSEQGQMSLEALSNVLLPNDTLASYGQGGVLISAPRPLLKGSLRGSDVSFQYPFAPGETIDYRQVTWVNNSTDKIWAFMIGCSASCYEQDQGAIGRIVNTFYVDDKGTK